MPGAPGAAGAAQNMELFVGVSMVMDVKWVVIIVGNPI